MGNHFDDGERERALDKTLEQEPRREIRGPRNETVANLRSRERLANRLGHCFVGTEEEAREARGFLPRTEATPHVPAEKPWRPSDGGDS